VLILNDRICNGDKTISDNVSLLPPLKILISSSILAQDRLSPNGIPLAKDYLISSKCKFKDNYGIDH
jgi:hypothetical protein